jgi:protoheme IX farnesyltransferase
MKKAYTDNGAAVTAYYRLTKPGIIYGNLLTALAGFLLAANGHVDFVLLIGTLLGLGFIIASACVFNNFIDRDIDRLMARTRSRALATRTIPTRNALLFATVLLAGGVGLLVHYSTAIATLVAIGGFIVYLGVYTVSKRHTRYSTALGSISGAVPPVVGYMAVKSHADITILVLFLVLVFWQMAHFYAIAIFRADDYRAAGLPVFSLVRGTHLTKRYICIYIFLFIISCSLLGVLGTVHITSSAILALIGIVWLVKGLQGISTASPEQDVTWAREMFFMSLKVIVALCIVLACNYILP